MDPNSIDLLIEEVKVIKAKIRPAGEMESHAIEVNTNFVKQRRDSEVDMISDIIEHTFVDSDNDSSGGLDRWELFDALTKLDYDLTPEICQCLLTEFSTGNNSYLGPEEFASLMTDKVSEDVSEVYAMFANERDGMLASGALRRALELMGVDLNAKMTKSLLDEYDRDGDGKLGLLGFADLVSSSPTAQFWLAVDESGVLRKIRTKALSILSRAPKKPVSLHSILSGCTVAAAALVLLTLFDPGFDEFGYPQLFRVDGPLGDNVYVQVQAILLFQMITSVMGLFRLPKNSIRLRRVGMENGAFVCLQFGLASLSSLNGTGIYLFDAYTPSFAFLALIVNALSLKAIFELIDCTATAGDVVTLTGVQVQAYLPLLGIKKEALAYAEAFSPLHGAALTAVTVFINMVIGSGALLGTLQFEKKFQRGFQEPHLL